jgi:hypothetical protein
MAVPVIPTLPEGTPVEALGDPVLVRWRDASRTSTAAEAALIWGQ